MTRDERNRRWQEIFDAYDKAIAEFHTQMTLRQALAPQFSRVLATLDEMAGTLDEQAAAAKRVLDATLAANREALALYRDEREDSAR